MNRIHALIVPRLSPAARRGIPIGTLLIALLLAGTGCRHQANSAAEINPAGTYTLVSVDGKSLPASIEHEGVTMILKSGSFVIGPDGTSTSRTTFSVPPHSDLTRQVQATFTREGSKLTLRWQGAGITEGIVRNGSFTMNNEGMVLVYRK